MADTLASGASVRKDMRVRVPLSAQRRIIFWDYPRKFIFRQEQILQIASI